MSACSTTNSAAALQVWLLYLATPFQTQVIVNCSQTTYNLANLQEGGGNCRQGGRSQPGPGANTHNVPKDDQNLSPAVHGDLSGVWSWLQKRRSVLTEGSSTVFYNLLLVTTSWLLRPGLLPDPGAASFPHLWQVPSGLVLLLEKLILGLH